MPTFSFIIPSKPGETIKALGALSKLDAGDFPHEILIAEGRQPSRQRNLAANQANGDVLYFLDDDSLVSPDCLTLCIAAFNDPLVAVAGGPSLTPDTDSWLQQLFGQALCSAFGAGGMRNRYRATGAPRETSEKELILCNMAIQRNVFLNAKGFDERLYPNEENELLNRIGASGHKLMHIPAMAVLRSQRKSLKAFVRQMFSYGRGRGQQTVITRSCPLTSFIPLVFVLYLALFPLFPPDLIWKLPLVLYSLLDVIATTMVLLTKRKMFFLFLIAIFPLMHLSNGIGLLWGLIGGKRKSDPDGKITIRIAKRF